MLLKPYPNSTDTPSRKTRKSDRNKVFLHNKKIGKAARKERRLARQEASNENA